MDKQGNVPLLDAQLHQLMGRQQLTEDAVKTLCEAVRHPTPLIPLPFSCYADLPLEPPHPHSLSPSHPTPVTTPILP